MHTRRVAACLLGAWLLGSILVPFTAITNTGSVERLFAAPFPAAAELIKTVGTDAAREVLRYQAAEQNQLVRSYWGIAEIGIGLALVTLLASAASVNRIVVGAAGAMVLLATFLRFAVGPEMHYATRAALIAGGPAPIGLRNLYAGIEAVKLLLGCAVAVYLFAYKGPSRRDLRREMGVIKHANHGHVER